MTLHVHPKILSAVKRRAFQFFIDPKVVLAVIEVESGFDPWASGDQGHSIGLGQLHDKGAGSGMSIAEREDPWRNIEVLTQYLANCHGATGDWPDAFSAYNQGIGGWQRNGRSVNQGYVDKVVAVWDRLSDEGYDDDFPKGLRSWD